MKLPIAVLTMMTRPWLMDRVSASIAELNKTFAATWHVLPVDPVSPISMGSGLNKLVNVVTSCGPNAPWCIIVDDDNIVHPDFGPMFQNWLNLNVCTHDVVLFRQYLRDGMPRNDVFNPLMKHGRVDAAQIGFRAAVAKLYTFPDAGYGVDGFWAESLAKAGYNPPVLDVPTYYNFLRP